MTSVLWAHTLGQSQESAVVLVLDSLTDGGEGGRFVAPALATPS